MIPNVCLPLLSLPGPTELIPHTVCGAWGHTSSLAFRPVDTDLGTPANWIYAMPVEQTVKSKRTRQPSLVEGLLSFRVFIDWPCDGQSGSSIAILTRLLFQKSSEHGLVT